MELLVQYGISLTFTRWLAVALLKRMATMQLGNWISMPQNGTSTRLSLVPVQYNVYTKGLADLRSNALSLVRTSADDGHIYKTASNTHTAVTAVKEQLKKVSQWYLETGSEINTSKEQALWCTLNNKAVEQEMPTVPFNGEVIEYMNSLTYLEIHFDRMLMHTTQVVSTKLKYKKALSTLNAMLQKALNNATCSCCITVSLTKVWVSQPCHSHTC